MKTRKQLIEYFDLNIVEAPFTNPMDLATELFEIQLAGRRHGRAGFYPNGDFSSDADGCYGVGAQITRLESLLEIDDGSIHDLYSEAHEQYFRDGTINANERSWHPGIYDFSFGAYGDTKVSVHAGSADDALETAAEWLKDNAPGLFSEPDYEDAFNDLRDELIAEGEIDETIRTFEDLRNTCSESPTLKVTEGAETDHTYTESGWLLSWEWTVDGPR